MQIQNLFASLNASAPGNTFAVHSVLLASDPIAAFISIAASLKNRDFWTLLGHVWRQTNTEPPADRLQSYLFCGRPDRQFIMTESERETLAALPERARIYRAATPEGRNGVSWTLDADVAQHFQKYRPGSQIWTREVSKSVIIACLSSGRPGDVLVMPE